MNSRLAKMVVLGIKQFRDPYYQGFAAQMSFYMLLSIVPTLLVLSQLLGILDISMDFLEEWIDSNMTTGVSEMLKPMFSYRTATSSNIVMMVMALWAASRTQFSMMRIANYTYTEGKTTGSFLGERLRSLFTMLLTLFTVVFVAVILVYGKLILLAVFGRIIEGSVIEHLWTFLRWPIAGALYFLTVSYNYYVLPHKKLAFREVVPGSIFGAIGMLVVTIVYSAYVNYTVNYNIIYGSLANIVAVLFWFYFLSWVLCLGILFNKVWKDTKNE